MRRLFVASSILALALGACSVSVVGDEGTEEKSNFQPLIIKIKALSNTYQYALV